MGGDSESRSHKIKTAPKHFASGHFTQQLKKSEFSASVNSEK